MYQCLPPHADEADVNTLSSKEPVSVASLSPLTLCLYTLYSPVLLACKYNVRVKTVVC